MISKQVAKKRIISTFKKNVMGKYPSFQELKSNHEGALGHWLEANLGKAQHDADGSADFWGWECKVDSKKISWGDWTPSYRIFCDSRYGFNKKTIKENQRMFVRIFGVYRAAKQSYSWSGRHVPKKINDKTSVGMNLVREKNKDISIYYDFSLDIRKNKSTQVPKALQLNNLLLYRWHGTNESFESYKINVHSNNLPIRAMWKGKNAITSLEERVSRKFNIHGMFKAMYNKNSGFYALAFIDAISFDQWISFFENKDIIFDTGLTERNDRAWNQWRSDRPFMNSLITDFYPTKIAPKDI